MHESLTFWIAFNAFVLVMLALDLGVFHRRNEKMSFRSAIGWSIFWIVLAAAFAMLVYFLEGKASATQFVTGYIIEETLSVDNLFFFLILFRYFRVPAELEYRVLFWGILGALVLRGAFIAVGVTLIARFDWIIYIFGAFLIFTAIRMLVRDEHAQQDLSRNIAVRAAKRVVPVTADYSDGHFFIVRTGVRMATPLFLVLLVLEITDVLFATDSIPAVLAISRDSFIVYTSNIFAILGLRALYFTLASAMEMFRYLDEGVAVILAFVGGKMIASHWYEISTETSLMTIAAILTISIAASIIANRVSPNTA